MNEETAVLEAYVKALNAYEHAVQAVREALKQEERTVLGEHTDVEI